MNRTLTGIRADSKHSYQTIEQCANVLREMLKLGPRDPLDAKNLFDQVIATMTVECHAGVVPLREAVEECSQEGLTRWDTESGVLDIVLSAKTYELLQQDHVRARSTVAHECGHACLHTDQIIRLGGMNHTSKMDLHRERGSHDACQDTEWQANAFGSALLMPAEGIEKLVLRFGKNCTQAIAEAFWVSLESAGYRLATYEKSLDRK
jgi:IrrE N-terminal-like domain